MHPLVSPVDVLVGFGQVDSQDLGEAGKASEAQNLKKAWTVTCDPAPLSLSVRPGLLTGRLTPSPFLHRATALPSEGIRAASSRTPALLNSPALPA